MVAIAQLAEHRIVVPSVVGSSPTSHPKKRQPNWLSFFVYAPFYIYVFAGVSSLVVSADSVLRCIWISFQIFSAIWVHCVYTMD